MGTFIIKIKGGKMNILIACEESQTICKEFRNLGMNAYSCDIVECSGGYPEWHFKQDCLEILSGGELKTQNNLSVYINKWDLLIGHPPCTYLSSSGACWYYHPDDKHLPTNKRRAHPKYPNRAKDRENAILFFMKLMDSGIKHIALENPVGIMSSHYRKPDQIIQPYQFGDEAQKTTCLWLKNLPKLVPTKIVGKGEMVEYSSGKKMPKWYVDALINSKTKEERQRLRSKTFEGIAKAIASQWGDYMQNIK